MATQITPEQENVWALRTSITKSVDTNDGSRQFIAPFLLTPEFASRFIAVGITTAPSRENWRFGGFLAQDFSFASSGYQTSGKAFFRTEELIVNQVSIVELPVVTDQPYRLRYFPPSWFIGMRLQVWEYTGVVTDSSNIVLPELDAIDILLNEILLRLRLRVGSEAIGDEFAAVLTDIGAIRADIFDGFSSLGTRLNQKDVDDLLKHQVLLRELQKIDAGLYTLAEGLEQIAPRGRDINLTQTIANRTNLNTGFL